MLLETIAGTRGIWVDTGSVVDLADQDTVNVEFDSKHSMILPTSEFLHEYNIAKSDPDRRRGTEVFVPIAWLVGGRVGY